MLLIAVGFAALDVTLAQAADRAHFYDQPYECTLVREIVSSSTGKKRTLYVSSVYFPSKGWRLHLGRTNEDAAFKVANLFTADTRYDGYYNQVNGKITKVVMGTAWPNKNGKRRANERTKRNDDPSKCAVLDDARRSLFQFDDLDTLEVMGQ